MFSLVRYGPLWPCSLRGRSRARVLDIPPRHFLADFDDTTHSEAPRRRHREPLRDGYALPVIVHNEAAAVTDGDVQHLPAARVTAGMPSCVAKQVTKPVRNREARVTEPQLE